VLPCCVLVHCPACGLSFSPCCVGAASSPLVAPLAGGHRRRPCSRHSPLSPCCCIGGLRGLRAVGWRSSFWPERDVPHHRTSIPLGARPRLGLCLLGPPPCTRRGQAGALAGPGGCGWSLAERPGAVPASVQGGGFAPPPGRRDSLSPSPSLCSLSCGRARFCASVTSFPVLYGRACLCVTAQPPRLAVGLAIRVCSSSGGVCGTGRLHSCVGPWVPCRVVARASVPR